MRVDQLKHRIGVANRFRRWLHFGHLDLKCPWIVYIYGKKFSSRFMLGGEACAGNINAGVIGRKTTKIMSVQRPTNIDAGSTARRETGSGQGGGVPAEKGQHGEED